LGTASLSNSSHFPPADPIGDTPVMLPPGRAKLATKPALTGSPASMTMGIVVVVCWAARVASVLGAMMTSTWSRTNSAARSGRRFWLPLCPSVLHGEVLSLNIAELA